jgi:predicted transcriptional regulator of viral defense system
LEIFSAQKGYLQSKQLISRTQRHRLNELVDAGEVTKVKRGLYKHTQMTTEDEWAEVSRIVPNGVICLFSAWLYYGLTTHIPSEHHMAIPNKSKVVLPPFPPIKIYYWSDNYYNLGKIKDNGINIYTVEKSVCDAIRFRNKVGKDIATEVLRNYLMRTDKNIDLLLKCAKPLRVESILMQYIELLI